MLPSANRENPVRGHTKQQSDPSCSALIFFSKPNLIGPAQGVIMGESGTQTGAGNYVSAFGADIYGHREYAVADGAH